MNVFLLNTVNAESKCKQLTVTLLISWNKWSWHNVQPSGCEWAGYFCYSSVLCADRLLSYQTGGCSQRRLAWSEVQIIPPLCSCSGGWSGRWSGAFYTSVCPDGEHNVPLFLDQSRLELKGLIKKRISPERDESEPLSWLKRLEVLERDT